MNTSKSGKLVAWLRLLRAPNLLTVPGDPIAGYVLAGGAFAGAACAKLAACAGASVMLYCSGLIFNDLFDLREDRRRRPDRPLPAGEISPTTAAIVALVLLAGGYALAWPAGTLARIIAAGLVAAIVLYNAGAKRIAVAGPINMGMCRGLSLLLGAAPVCKIGLRSPAVLAGAGLLTGYIAVVTYVAKAETQPSLLPVLRRLNPKIIQKMIGTLIRLLLVYQAAVAATAGPVGWAVAACLLAAWCISALLARRFYAS